MLKFFELYFNFDVFLMFFLGFGISRSDEILLSGHRTKGGN